MALETGMFSISSLREQPGFAFEVADRVWRAWWREKGVPLEYLTGLVKESMLSAGIPMAMVAHRNGTFLGTASLIAGDMDERPQYTPWVAAVWVDAEHRNTGIGSALVAAAARTAFQQNVETVYLGATEANSLFYEKQGWCRIETDVGGLNIFALSGQSES